MTADVLRGPWPGPPVIQEPESDHDPQGWWRRNDSGRLYVRNRARGPWLPAPAPMAPLTPRPGHHGGLARRHPVKSTITLALDARGMDGPEVDEALGVEDGVVDLWEDYHHPGILPTTDEVRRLAWLTQLQAWFFYYGTDELPPAHGPCQLYEPVELVEIDERLVPCERCGRRFEPRGLASHARACARRDAAHYR